MARTLTYQQVYDIVKASGGFNSAGAGAVTVSINGTITIDLTAYQEQVLKLDFKEFTDSAFTTDISQQATTPPLDELFSVDKKKTNIYEPSRDGGSALLNADRIIINAKSDYAMLFGKQGVAIASPERVNIDSGESITIFSHDSVFLGLPNKGREASKTATQKELGTTKGDPTPDFLYEPLVLGVKLANLLEDIIYAVQNADMVSGISEATFQPSAVAELELIKNRIPEMLSTFGFIDGISHEQVDMQRAKKLQKAQAKAKKYTPPKELVASVVATIDPPVDGLQPNAGAVEPTTPIGTAEVVAGAGGAPLTSKDQEFAAKYNNGVLPVKLYSDGTIPLKSGGPVPTRAWYQVNSSYEKGLISLQAPRSKDGINVTMQTIRVHPQFANKLSGALAEITQNGGGVYIHDISGGIYARNITNGECLSHHAWALAIDINTGGGQYQGALAGTSAVDWGWGTVWKINERTVNGKPWTSAHQGFYDKVASVMWKHGIGWYYKKDSMHFSVLEGTALAPDYG